MSTIAAVTSVVVIPRLVREVLETVNAGAQALCVVCW